MKKESTKKTPKWLLPVIIAAAVLVIAGIVLAIFLGPWNLNGDSTNAQSKLYWNVDRLANIEEESGMSVREKGADGLYTIRFALDGELVEHKAADKKVVNAIDFMQVMGLEFDADGLIIGIIDPKTIATEVALEYFVKSYDGKTLSINSSVAMNGMPMDLEITDKTGVYDVAPDAETPGATCDLNVMDRVTVYADAEGTVTHVFLVERAVEAEIYWRVNRFYDKTKGTTREPDENGVYTIPFAYKGQQIELKCKDKDVVTQIDSKYYSNVCMGLLFNDEGYITGILPAAQAMRAKLLFSDYTVTAIEGDTISLESILSRNKDLGTTGTMVLPENCEIYLMEDGCEAEFIGQAVPELKVNDLVYVFSDLEDTPLLIYISRRKVDSPMYKNKSAKYSSTTKETTRVPDEKGYYVFEIIGEGKLLTLRTKDKALATKIDATSSGTSCFGLKYTGDIIEEVYASTCVCGGSSLSNRFVTENMGSIVRAVSRSDFASGGNYMVAADCKVYDITDNYGTVYGAETTLRKYDFGTGFLNESDEICYYFITQRYVEGTKAYYNYARSYDSTLKETKRTPDENGYYVFEMACEGKTVTVKTKDKAMASWIDKQSPAWVALTVSGGIVKGAYKVASAFPAARLQMQGVYVDKVNPDGTFTYLTKAGAEGQCTFPVTGKTGVYNVSAVFNDIRGEKTKLQKGDLVYPIVNCETKDLYLILVTGGREIDSPLYYNKSRQYNFTTKETLREPDADGWYVYELAVKGEVKTFRTKDKAIADSVDSRSGVFALRVDGDVIQQVYTYVHAKDLEETKVGNGYTVTAINGNEMTLTDMRATSTTKGNVIKVPLSKKCEIYNVSPYAEPFGAAATLSVGDKVSFYGNKEGIALYVYITAKNTRTAGLTGKCDHCGETVTWEPFIGTVATTDTHYYLPADATYAQLQVGYTAAKLAQNEKRKQYEMILDLNGHTLTGKTRAFLVYGTLSILDSVGGGVVQGNTGSALMISSQDGATLNLYSGTLKPGANIAEPITRGGTFHGSNCTVNIYGGTIIGGTAESGGVAYLNAGTLNIYGGTIKGGTATSGGGGCFYLLDTTVNMTGGTIEAGTASGSGGGFYLHKNKVGSTMTMSGGTITGGDAVSGDALAVSTNGAFTMTGGKIDSELYISAAATEATFSGTPVITGQLRVPTGTLINLDQLTQGASIAINAEGVFTKENEKAADYAGYFRPARALDTVTVTEDGKALTYTKYVVDGNAIDNSDLVFDAGTNLAVCPTCGDKVEWTALDQATYAQTAYGSASDGTHVYLAEDITYTGEGSFLSAPSGSGNIACVHLNGKNITSTASAVFFGSGGTLNIMGNGTVTGYNGTSTTGSAVGINTSGSKGTINLYGGTYAPTSDSVAYTIGLNNNGGTINLYKAVTVNGNSRNRYIRVGSAKLSNAVLGIYGATVNGRVRVEGAEGETYTSTVVIENAVIKGDLNIYGAGTVCINGAEFKNNVNVNGTGPVVLSGAVKFTGDGVLTVAEGSLITLGELVEGTSIPVSAVGTFTEVSANAPACVGFFRAAVQKDSIGLTEDNLALCYVPYVFDGNKVDNSNLVFDEGTTDAVCPVCDLKVTWTALTAETEKLEGHMYLAEDVTYAGNKYSNTNACLHLNGFKVESTSGRPIQASSGGTLNVMGNGTVKGVGSGLNPSAAAAWGGTLNLYGGTYNGTTSRIIGMNSGGGSRVTIYSGVTVEGNVLLRGTESAPASLLIAGGNITGTISCRGGYGTITVEDGNFTGGKLLYEEENTTGTITVDISGGTFAFTQWYAREDANGDMIASITGGTYAMDPTAYVAEGYVVTANEDGTFIVTAQLAVTG